jgi:dTDP-4-amino-4,6-dideoxygalactose transaminase
MKHHTDFIPFSRPSFCKKEETALLETLRSGWVSTAGVTEKFEKEFARFLGTPHAVAVNSATAGLHLALKAAGVSRGDKVITTPFTFAATAEVCRYEGAHPLFVDIEEDSLNIDPGGVEAAVRQEAAVSAVMPVHIAGLPCKMEQILAAAEEAAAGKTEAAGSVSGTHLPVIEDAAHAFPVKTARGWLGTLGDIGVFSFYATKPITTGEGGMVVTGNETHAERMKLLRLHGIDRPVWDRYQTTDTGAWDYEVVTVGYKYNMSDLMAAIGRVQLSKAKDFLKRRKEIAARYRERLEDEDYLILPKENRDHSWHLFILRIRPEKLQISRDRFMQSLAQRNIGLSLHFKPLHLMVYYRKKYGYKPEDFPVSLRVYQTCFSIPIYPGLTNEQVDYIADSIKTIGRASYNPAVYPGAGGRM